MLLSLIILFVFAYFVYVQLAGKSAKYPPGPRPWPFMGNLMLMDDQDPAAAVNREANERGGSLMSILIKVP